MYMYVPVVNTYMLSFAWQPKFERLIPLATGDRGGYKVARVGLQQTSYYQLPDHEKAVHLMMLLSHGLTTFMHMQYTTAYMHEPLPDTLYCSKVFGQAELK